MKGGVAVCGRAFFCVSVSDSVIECCSNLFGYFYTLIVLRTNGADSAHSCRCGNMATGCTVWYGDCGGRTIDRRIGV